MKKMILPLVVLLSFNCCLGNEVLKSQIARLIEMQPELQARVRENHPELLVPDGESRVLTYLKNLLRDPEGTLRSGEEEINRAFRPSVGVYLLPDEFSWERSDLHAAPFILWPLPGRDFEAFPEAAYRYRNEWLNLVWQDKGKSLDGFLVSSLRKCIQDLNTMVGRGLAPPRIPEVLKEMYSDERFLDRLDQIAKEAGDPADIGRVIMEFGRIMFVRFPSSFDNLIPYLEMDEIRYANELLRKRGLDEEGESEQWSLSRKELRNARYYEDVMKELGVELFPGSSESVSEEELIRRLSRLRDVKRQVIEGSFNRSQSGDR